MRPTLTPLPSQRSGVSSPGVSSPQTAGYCSAAASLQCHLQRRRGSLWPDTIAWSQEQEPTGVLQAKAFQSSFIVLQYKKKNGWNETWNQALRKAFNSTPGKRMQFFPQCVSSASPSKTLNTLHLQHNTWGGLDWQAFAPNTATELLTGKFDLATAQWQHVRGESAAWKPARF